MSTATAITGALIGLTYHQVTVAAKATPGAGEFAIVGLSDAAAREVRVRVRSSLAQLGVHLGDTDIAIALEPLELRKGPGVDLAIACAVLAAIGDCPSVRLEQTLLVGELSLTGALRPTRGVLPMLLGAAKRAVVPAANGAEAGVAPIALVADTLADVWAWVRAERGLDCAETAIRPDDDNSPDMADVRGQYAAKRALEIAAAGGYGVLMIGPPGSGKTMLARRVAGILPALTASEALEATAVHSVAGILPATGAVTTHPFRAPHHTVSEEGLLGGGDPARPGEVSLATHGVLYLDELAEFRVSTLNALRGALSAGETTKVRGGVRATFPAKPMVVASVNPCSCGWRGDPRCTCTAKRLDSWRAMLASRPLLDTIELRVHVDNVDAAALRSAPAGEPSAQIRDRVACARAFAAARTADAATTFDASSITVLDAAVTTRHCPRDATMRVARTIADLDGSNEVQVCHMAEACTLTAP